MAEPCIAKDLAYQLSQEEGRSLLSLTTYGGELSFSSACIMDAEYIAEPWKRGHRKLPTRSLVAMTCGVGGYVTN
jgi:hypothetical protein